MEWTHLEEVLERYGNEVAEGYKENLQSKDINASGDLAQSVQYRIERNGSAYEVSLQLADYWKWIEKGRRPGKMPPLGAIEKWIKVKPVIPKPYNGKLPTEKQLAFLIGRKIALEGTEARHPLRDTLEDKNQEFLLQIEKAFMEDLEAQVDEVLVMLNNA